MSKGINLSPKHGVNPTVPICFWCGKEKNEIALLGRIGDKKDFEAPKNMVLDFKPCDECLKKMETGITFMESTDRPNSRCEIPYVIGCYPTGKYVVIKTDAAKRIFGDKVDFDKHNKVFLDSAIYKEFFSNAEEFIKSSLLYTDNNKNKGV